MAQGKKALIGLDSETWPIRPGLQAPPVVCGQVYEGERPEILDARGYLARLERYLSDPSILLTGHSISYDFACAAATWPHLLPAIFQAYAEDRIACTMVREKLGRIADGSAARVSSFSLVACLDRHGIEHRYRTASDGTKAEAWRTEYHTLVGVPVESWPADAIRYAEEDAIAPVRLYEHQRGAFSEYLADQYRQARADFVLRLISARGFAVDGESLRAFAAEVADETPRLIDRLRAAGLLRPTGTKDTKAAKRRMVEACAAANFPVPITATGKAKGLAPADAVAAGYVSLTAEATDAVASVDPILGDWSRFVSLTSLQARIDRLSRAHVQGSPIQSRYDTIKATGRTSVQGATINPGSEVLAWGDQIQNPHRAPGVREAYVPRPGYLLAMVDFGAAELHTFAQVCTDLGLRSNLAEVLRSGKDAHLAFGAAIRGWSYDWAKSNKNNPEFKALIKAARQGAKAANFGFPGGLGVEKFRMYAAQTYGVILSEAEARDLRESWFAFYPEAREYFAIITQIVDSGVPLRHPRSDRYRGDLRFTSACNSLFQGLAADMAKDAGFNLTRAMYTDRNSVLFGSRLVAFVHDEFLAEVPEDYAGACADEIARIMGEAGDRWTPCAPCRAEPALAYRWRKGAEPVRLPNGTLIPWEDREFTDADAEQIRKLRADGLSDWSISWRVGREVEAVRCV